jgi:hypothetical protein
MMIIAEIAVSFTPSSPAQDHGYRHRDDYQDPALQRPDAQDGDEKIRDHDPEGYSQRQLYRTPAALADRQS